MVSAKPEKDATYETPNSESQFRVEYVGDNYVVYRNLRTLNEFAKSFARWDMCSFVKVVPFFEKGETYRYTDGNHEHLVDSIIEIDGVKSAHMHYYVNGKLFFGTLEAGDFNDMVKVAE